MSYKFVRVGNLQFPQYDLQCADCGAEMLLVSGESLNRSLMYRCSNWPECGCVHSAFPNGKPVGTPADKHTRWLRHSLHELMDPLWRQGHMERDELYKRLARRLMLDKKECHVGSFDADQCERAKRFISAVWDSVLSKRK
jgi:ssDNA-binding Zn-finger/Zn-ribbon topoisomerase 1